MRLQRKTKKNKNLFPNNCTCQEWNWSYSGAYLDQNRNKSPQESWCVWHTYPENSQHYDIFISSYRAQIAKMMLRTIFSISFIFYLPTSNFWSDPVHLWAPHEGLGILHGSLETLPTVPAARDCSTSAQCHHSFSGPNCDSQPAESREWSNLRAFASFTPFTAAHMLDRFWTLTVTAKTWQRGPIKEGSTDSIWQWVDFRRKGIPENRVLCEEYILIRGFSRHF